MYLDMWVFVQAAAGTIDYIIDTVSATHPLDPYLSTLKLDGKLVMVGIPQKPVSIHAFSLTSGKAPNSSSTLFYLFVCLFVCLRGGF
jgi:D-arabinose 1-dehydrogenase-like Zn-dependent alcohol dehydrogenase